MRLCRALLFALTIAPLAAGATLAQTAPDPFGPPKQQSASDPFGPPPGQTQTTDPFGPAPAQSRSPAPFGAPIPQQGFGAPMAAPAKPQMPPCIAQFFKLRDDAQKKAQAIQKASEHKASPKEACHLFTVFSAAEAKLLKYAADNKTSCGVPDEVIKQIKSGHSRTTELKTKICKVAAAPRVRRGPR